MVVFLEDFIYKNLKTIQPQIITKGTNDFHAQILPCHPNMSVFTGL